MIKFPVPTVTRRISRIALLVLVTACGGGGADPVAPPGPPPTIPPTSTPGKVASVTVGSTNNTVLVGEALQLAAIVRDADNQVLSGRTITWISSNPALATVANTGLVIGRYAGTVTVRATVEGVTASAEIAVTIPTKPSAVANYSVLDSAQTAFLRFAAQTGGDPARALGLVGEWAAKDPRIARVDLIDSTYLQLQLKSGMVTIIRYTELDAQRRSTYRGGGRDGSSGYSGLARFGSASQVISNKKVLICAATYFEFYPGDGLKKIVKRFEDAGLGFQVTLLKDKQCNYRLLPAFANYGLVILDTHGVPNGFMTGESLTLDAAERTTEATIKTAIDAHVAPGTYDKFTSGDLAIVRNMGVLVSDPEWWKTVDGWHDEIWVTSQFVRTLRLPNTVVFGNMCYSGFISHPTRTDPLLGGYIQPAFMSTGLRSYYSYSLLDGSSLKVTNDFAVQMEDSLTYALVVDGDSTGIAHLSSSMSVFLDRPWHDRFLRFTQYGALGFGYFRLAITPDTAMGESGVPIAFTADDFDTAPQHALYKWDFGDGTPVVSVTDKPDVMHTYQFKTLPYNVSVTLYNNADPARPTKIATATAKARALDPFVVTPASIASDPGQNVTLTARPGGRAPTGAKYRWNFGDGSPVVTIVSDSVARHVFAGEGAYDITVQLIEPTQNRTLATARASVTTSLWWTVTSMTAPVSVGPTAVGSGVADYDNIIKQLNAVRAKPNDMRLHYGPTTIRGVGSTKAALTGIAIVAPGQETVVSLDLGATAVPIECFVDNALTNPGGGSSGTTTGHWVKHCQPHAVADGQPSIYVRYVWTDFAASKSGSTLSGTIRFTISDYVGTAPYYWANYRLMGQREVTVAFAAERLVFGAASN